MFKKLQKISKKCEELKYLENSKYKEFHRTKEKKILKNCRMKV